MKDREADKAVTDTKAAMLQCFMEGRADEAAQVYKDDRRGYIGIDRAHGSVCHSTGDHVRDMAHTNGMESFCSMLERAHNGVLHKFSGKPADRYVTESAGRHNAREADTTDQMEGKVAGMAGKRLRYCDLIAVSGLPSGARA